MIEFVYGAKGSGKTKKMIDMANDALETCNGDINFINDRDKYRVKVDTKIRFINLEEFEVLGTDQLFGFISGLIAENYDVKLILLDNLLRIIDAQTPDDVCNVIERINKLQEKHDIKFVLSLSIDESELPACVKKLIN
jgi:thymidine kinase